MRKSTIKTGVVCTLVLFLLSSCATIFNGPVQKVSIATDKHVKIISVEKATVIDSSRFESERSTAYFVPRGRVPIKINLQINDSLSSIYLKGRNSFAYWGNVENYCIGMLVDRDNPKRFSYRHNNYLAVNNGSLKNSRFAPAPKGSSNLFLSPTFGTIFNIKKTGKHFEGGGLLGLEIGIDHYYKDNRYTSFHIGAGTSRVGIVDYFGPGYIETGSTQFASFRNNYVLGSFDLGYGINVSRLKWSAVPIGDSLKMGASRANVGAGLSFLAQYRISNYFRMGMLYQPNLWNMSFKPAFSYQHYISFNLIWTVPMKKAHE